MFLSKLPNGVYYIFFFDELGNRHKVSTRCKLKSDALRFLQQFRQSEHERKVKLQRVSLTQFSDDYLKCSRTVLAPKSQESACTSLREFVRIVGDIPLHKVGVKQLTKDYLSKRFKRYVHIAGMNPKLHFHSLRHTFATWLVQDGVSLYEVQKLLGHSSIAVTQVYSHLQPEQLHATVNRIVVSLN